MNGEKKAWIDRDLRVELRKRNELFKLKKNNPNNLIYGDEFNRVKKKVAAKINVNRKNFFDSKFTESANNPKQIWHNINSLIYNKNPNKSEIIAIKNQSGQLLNEKETANAFNVYFTELPQNTIRGEYGDVNRLQIKLTSSYAELESIFLYEVDENEIFEIIMKLKKRFLYWHGWDKHKNLQEMCNHTI